MANLGLSVVKVDVIGFRIEVARVVSLVALACGCMLPGSLQGQETTAPAEATLTTETITTRSEAVETTASEQQLPDATTGAEASDTTHTIVLLGDVGGLNPESPRQPPYPDLLTAVQATLGTDVADYTSVGLTLQQTAEMVKAAPNVQADIALVFGGLADEQQEKPEDEIRADAMGIAAELSRRNPEMRIFLLPTTTYLGTLISAQLRLAAEEANMTFVTLGTEVGGEPYREAMRTVAEELQQEPDTASQNAVQEPASQNSVTVRGRSIESEPIVAPQGRPATYEQSQASLERELNRIAGDTSESGILPRNVEALSSQTLFSQPATADPATTGMEIPPGGRVTRRGKEAQENINMRPLPALKAYEPQIPVPRNEVDRKEPALSR